MKRLMLTIDIVETTLLAVLMGSALFLACLSTVGRYLLPGLRLDWTLEVTIFLSTWAVLVGAARLVGTDGHVRVDSLLAVLPRPLRFVFNLLSLLCYIGVAAFLLWSGMIVVDEAMRWNEVTTSSLRIPLWYYYLCLPVSMGLMLLHALVRFVERLTGRRFHPGIAASPGEV